MAELVYMLCAATSVFCAFMLARSFFQARSRLLLVSTLCFLGLAVNSTVLVVDLVVLPDIDFRMIRTTAAFVSVFVMLIGLIWESR
jgi:hypothetical protein